jgi:hypothetical protein
VRTMGGKSWNGRGKTASHWHTGIWQHIAASRRNARSCHGAGSQGPEEVTRHLPHLSHPQAAVLALWRVGMVRARSGALSAVRLFFAKGLARKPNTVRQQVREWGYEAKAQRGKPRRALAVDPGFAPLVAWVRRWGEGTQLALAVAATTLGHRGVGLVVSVGSRGGALPGAGTVRPATEQPAWRREWLRRLRPGRAVVPRRFFVSVLADRGL